MPAIWTLINTKGGIAVLGLLACLLLLGYYKAKIAGIEALHSIEVSQLQAEAEKQKAAAEINGKRNEVCQADMVVVTGQIAAQNAAVARLQAEGDQKARRAVAAALAALKPAGKLKELATAGPVGPAGMNLFMARTFGEGVL